MKQNNKRSAILATSMVPRCGYYNKCLFVITKLGQVFKSSTILDFVNAYGGNILNSTVSQSPFNNLYYRVSNNMPDNPGRSGGISPR